MKALIHLLLTKCILLPNPGLRRTISVCLLANLIGF